jgi:transcriptional regulator with XRE-family HTH domain
MGLAAACDVSPVTVRLWERGLADPLLDHQRMLERVLGVSWVTLSKEA